MNVGEYEIRYFNKYGILLSDLTETRKTLDDADQRGEYRIKHPTDTETATAHYMPHRYQVLRLLHDSSVEKK